MYYWEILDQLWILLLFQSITPGARIKSTSLISNFGLRSCSISSVENCSLICLDWLNLVLLPLHGHETLVPRKLKLRNHLVNPFAVAVLFPSHSNVPHQSSFGASSGAPIALCFFTWYSLCCGYVVYLVYNNFSLPFVLWNHSMYRALYHVQYSSPLHARIIHSLLLDGDDTLSNLCKMYGQAVIFGM